MCPIKHRSKKKLLFKVHYKFLNSIKNIFNELKFGTIIHRSNADYIYLEWSKISCDNMIENYVSINFEIDGVVI
jgi:hypothetical protein